MDTSGTYIKTPEHKQKLSVAMLGNQNQERVRSPKTRAKISESMRGNNNTLGKVYGEEEWGMLNGRFQRIPVNA